MRHLKRIGFFLYSCLLLAGGFLGHIQFEAAFYPEGKRPFPGGPLSRKLRRKRYRLHPNELRPIPG